MIDVAVEQFELARDEYANQFLVFDIDARLDLLVDLVVHLDEPALRLDAILLLTRARSGQNEQLVLVLILCEAHELFVFTRLLVDSIIVEGRDVHVNLSDATLYQLCGDRLAFALEVFNVDLILRVILLHEVEVFSLAKVELAVVDAFEEVDSFAWIRLIHLNPREEVLTMHNEDLQLRALISARVANKDSRGVLLVSLVVCQYWLIDLDPAGKHFFIVWYV